MSHIQQVEYCNRIKLLHPEYFKNKIVLDVGCLDINGNNNNLFENCLYFGIDLGHGNNVDFISKGHEFNLPDESIDTIISTECFEHDMYYEKTLKNIYRMLKPGGFFIFSCATTGRPEHGTRRTRPEDAPLLSTDGWSDYYKNLTEADIRQVFNIEKQFIDFAFKVNEENHDLYFWGIKSGTYVIRNNYSFLIKENPYNRLQLDYQQKNNELQEKTQKLEEKTQELQEKTQELEEKTQKLQEKTAEIESLHQNISTKNHEIQLILSSNSWRITKPLRALFRLIKNAKN